MNCFNEVAFSYFGIHRAEDILDNYDTAFIVRFPDSLRTLDAVSYPPWVTRAF